MPFTKVGSNDYTSPSGRHFNQKQVNLWYSQGGKFPGQKGPGEMKDGKGASSQVGHYAQGGAVLGRTENWWKEPDRFRTDHEIIDDKIDGVTHDVFPKKGAHDPLAKPKGDKSLPCVKPRK